MGVRFEEFRFADVFTVEQVNKVKVSGKNYVPDNEIISDDGTVPYIAAISTNNGITGYSSKYEANNKGDCITLSTTADSSNTVFYQPDNFIGRQQIAGIRRRDKQKMGKYIGLYIVAIVKRVTVLFNYGTKLTVGYLRDKLINLPIKVDALGIPEKDTECYYHKDGYIPDFEYMEKYIAELEQERVAELEQERIAELEQYLIVTGLNDYTLTDEDKAVLSLHNAEWGNKDRDNAVVAGVRFEEFELGKLFDIENNWIYGKNKKWVTRFETPTKNSLPVISGVTINNGENYYTEDNYNSEEVFEDCLTISTRGEYSGTVFYHDGKFLLANNILAMPMGNLSKNCKLYLATCINKLNYGGYSGYPKKDTLKNDILYLPIVMNGNSPEIDTTYKYHKDGYIPDFEYMERYIKAMEKVVIADVVKYKDEVIAQTKALVNT